MRTSLSVLAAALVAGSVVSCKSAGAKPANRVRPAKNERGLTACPIISRGRPTETSKAMTHGDAVVDGVYKAKSWAAGTPSAEEPAWVAIDVGVGPERVLLTWTASGSFNHNETTYGGPGSYRIETSADSTNGKSGTWTTVATVPANEYRTRPHAFDFKGQRWVRMVVTGPSKQTYKYGIQIDEIDVHDVSAAEDDTWFFFGDSITAFSFDRAAANQPSFAENIAKAFPGHFPAMVNGGIGGEKSSEGLARLDALLKDNHAMHVWAIGFGTNDSAGNGTDTSFFQKNMEDIIVAVKAAGRVPMLARIPYAPKDHDGIPKFNEVVDALTRKHGLVPGPDLYAHFKAHPEELSDGLHPNSVGIKSINRLWAEAAAPLYTGAAGDAKTAAPKPEASTDAGAPSVKPAAP